MPDFLLSAFSDESARDLEGQIDALHRCGLKYMEHIQTKGNLKKTKGPGYKSVRCRLAHRQNINNPAV